jgi:pimeloyl-ACP methyl ester carboxylesterase
MKRIVAAALMVPSLLFAQGQQGVHDPVGHWLGVLSVGGIELRLALHVEAKGEGFAATLDSLDQGAKGLAVDSIVVEGTAVRLLMPKLGASFEGTFVDEGQAIDGVWKQGQSLPLRFRRTAEAPTLVRPQLPVPPFPYRSEAAVVPVKDGAGERTHSLAGTLTIPPGDGPFPAVVLISGSGPQDRDEALLGHQPFLVLADHLSRHGFAVLRCDDRGVGESTGTFAGCTSADFAVDARAMLDWLRAQPIIDAARVGLCGHSEGGLIAPIVAAGAPDAVAFCVLLAGPGVRGSELLALQMQLLGQSAGMDETSLAAADALNRRCFEIVATVAEPTQRREALLAAVGEAWPKLPPTMRSQLQNEAALWEQVEALDEPWMRFFLAYEPGPTLARVKCPVLALNGEKDLQVDHAQNLAALGKALEAGGNRDVTIVQLPGLNHLFQQCATGAVAEYGKIEQTIDGKVLQLVTDWMVPRFGRAR